MSHSAFEAVEQSPDFVALEEDTLRWWAEHNVLERYLQRNDTATKRHSFIDGPITANNPMGVHHAWGRFYKDAFQRLRNMQGFKQRFQNGFDGQGLWVEVEVEKELGFTSKKDIEAYGIDKFVEKCKARVRKFAAGITKESMRLGYFMDWDNSYHTMSDENNYAIWGFLKLCHEKGWLYEGEDVMPWCPRCGTGLSQHEIVTDGYREVKHPGLFVQFPLLDDDAALLVWTTTPWTLAANLAAAVHPDGTYVKVVNSWESAKGEQRVKLWLNEACLRNLKGKWEVVERAPGSVLVGREYSGPFQDLPAQQGQAKTRRVLSWPEVSNEEGTGIVHIAPGAGADDFKLGQANGLGALSPLDDEGVYKEGYGFLSGLPVTAVNEVIFEDLRRRELFYRVQQLTHRYPCCWRCGSELVFRLVSEWFISMAELRPKMMEATNNMEWVPAFGKERELDWLHNMQDWMISKKRYWGLALPIFKCGDCKRVEVVGSRKELEQRAVSGWDEFAGYSPHRPWLDAVTIACSGCNQPLTRIKDVGNPWLDAGIVGFSTLRYYEDRSYWREWFPADWFSESFPGQFRNWFYSLIAMSVAIADVAPASSVFSYALMRDENGNEMHKSRGNAIWFKDAAATIGVDVMRWLFARQDPARNMNFGYRPCTEIRRTFFIPLWNVYYFFITYARIDGWSPTSNDAAQLQLSDLDVWLRAELDALITTTTTNLETWKIDTAARSIETFIDLLSNWYVRRSRRRFWKGSMDGDKLAAYDTLYKSLTTLSKLLAPFTPFLAEHLHRNLVAGQTTTAPDSVHLADWPTTTVKPDDPEQRQVITRTRAVLKLSSMGRAARAQAGIKIRQPLAKATFTVPDDAGLNLEPQSDVVNILSEELNIKTISQSDNDLNRADSSAQGAPQVKLNYRKAGPKYGKHMRTIERLLSAVSATAITGMLATLEHDPMPISELTEFMAQPANPPVSKDEFEHLKDLTLTKEDLIIVPPPPIADVASVSEPDGWSVTLDLTITPALRAEGWVREAVHNIQNLRKTSGLEITDKICLAIATEGEALAALQQNRDFIAAETLASEVVFNDTAKATGESVPGYQAEEQFTLEGQRVNIALTAAPMPNTAT